jgi:hypothetical protein
MVTEDGSVAGSKTAGFAPCFPVRNVQEALAHYEQLGFDVMPYTAVEGTSDPYDTSYGREVVHVDLDSNLMRFIAPRRDHR